MRAFARFLVKEFVEFAKTWRLPVFGGIVLFFAVSGPVLALFTPELLKSVQGSQPGLVISLPEPTWADAYAQWIKNLTQIVTFVMIIAVAGSVASEVSAGTAAMVVTKPVSRSSFVLAKWAAFIVWASAVVLAAAGVTQVMTYALFGKAPGAPLWEATFAWIGYAAVLSAVGVLFSCVVPTLAAAALTMGTLVLVAIGSLSGWLVRYTPVGLASAADKILADKEPALLWPSVSAAIAVVVLLGVASFAFERRQL